MVQHDIFVDLDHHGLEDHRRGPKCSFFSKIIILVENVAYGFLDNELYNIDIERGVVFHLIVV